MRRSILLAQTLVFAAACDGAEETALVDAPTSTAVRFVNTRYVTPAPVVRPVAKKRRTKTSKPRKKTSVWDEIELELEAEDDADFLPWSLSEASFNAIVDDWTGVRTCVRAARATSGGALQMKFEIERTGAVKKARTIDTSNALASVIAPCVERKARRLKFPPFEDERVERVAKFVF